MRLSLLLSGENTGRLDNILCTGLTPWNARRILLHVESHLLAVDFQVFAIDFNAAVEQAVLGVVTQHVRGIVRLDEGIIAGDDLDVLVQHCVAEDNAADTTEAVDAYFYGHVCDLVVLVVRLIEFDFKLRCVSVWCCCS